MHKFRVNAAKGYFSIFRNTRVSLWITLKSAIILNEGTSSSRRASPFNFNIVFEYYGQFCAQCMAGLSFYQPFSQNDTTLWYTRNWKGELGPPPICLALHLEYSWHLGSRSDPTPAMWHLQNIWWAHSCQKGLKTPFPSHISLPVNSALWITCDLLRFFSLNDVTKRLLERLHSDGHLYTKAERPWHLRILNIYLLSNVSTVC